MALTNKKIENYKLDRIRRILQDAHSIHDVTVQHIVDLKKTQAGRFALDKYKVSVQDFEKWQIKDEVSGIEYDSRQERVIIKATDRANLHGFANDGLCNWFEQLTHTLWAASGGADYANVGNRSYYLSGPYVGDMKEPDQAVGILDAGYPAVVLDIGLCDNVENLFEGAKKWLEGSEGVTRGVIIVDIQRIQPPIEEESQNSSGQKLTWGKLNEELLKIGLSHGSDSLTGHIANWYKDNGCELNECATVTIYVCRKGEEPLRYWGCEFTPEKTNFQRDAPKGFFTPRELLGNKVAKSDAWAKKADDEIGVPVIGLANRLKTALVLSDIEIAGHMANFKVLALKEDGDKRKA